jgi:hypothetical protein|tara:strand:- start:863 stop:1174 length:312 start_codon:yes stop_codon:yes gene_type:complete
MNKTKADDYVYTAIDALDETSYGTKRQDKPKPSSGKDKWNKLNGWQKLWLASVVIQKFIIVIISIPTMDFSFAFIMLIIILNVNCLVYGIGLAIAWGLRRLKG